MLNFTTDDFMQGKTTFKRYEYRTRQGKEWTQWFPYDGKDRGKWQEKGHLRNEYREC